MTKKIKTHSIEIDWLYGDVEDVIISLQKAKADRPKALSLAVVQEWDSYEDCHDELTWTAYETDEEKVDRESIEKEVKDVKAKQKRAAEKSAKSARDRKVKDLQNQINQINSNF